MFDIQVQIFTISGKLVRTINTSQYMEGNRCTGIPWDGLDDYGDKIGKGVYMYRVRVRNQNNEIAEKIEKLVIL
jgi:flagellar hook assembly protein FlgD